MTLERTDRPDPNLPATRAETGIVVTDPDRAREPEWRQPVSVAFLPLALVTFIVVAFAMAMWTFLAATT